MNGYVIQFVGNPWQSRASHIVEFSQDASALVDLEVAHILDKGVAVHMLEDFFFFNFEFVFWVEKKDKGWRPVVNLRDLNWFVKHYHVKMEGIPVLRDILQEEDWLEKLDLRNAYFPIHMDYGSQNYINFR